MRCNSFTYTFIYLKYIFEMHTVNANIVMTMRLGDDNDVCLINRNSCIALANMQLSI